MFLFEQILIEAARDRYMEMFNFAKNNSLVSAAAMDTVGKHVDWAVKTIGDANKISWYVGYIKWQLLDAILSGKHDESDDLSTIQKQYNKLTSKLLRKVITVENLKREARFVDSPVFINYITHLSSNKSDAVKNIKWDEYTPSDLYDALTKAEEESLRNTLSRDRIINTALYDREEREKFEVLIEFPDGSMWVNLHKDACPIEAKAGGHCGNVPSRRSYHEVLSYRFPVDEKGERIGHAPDGWHLWAVRLTFILDTRDNTLGEMKGRFNEKPDPEYHPYIVALLKLPLIKGIVGGGYEPQFNFSLQDLSPEIAHELMTEKPELADLTYLVNNIDSELISKEYVYDRVYKAVDESVGVEGRDGDDIIIRRDDVPTFVDDLPKASYYYDYVTGDKYPEVYSYDIDSYIREEVLAMYLKKNPDDADRLKAYMESEYRSEFEDEFDKDDLSDIITVLNENSDDLLDSIDRAVYRAEESAASDMIYTAFYEWLNSVEVYENQYEVELVYDDKTDTIEYLLAIKNIIRVMQNEGVDDLLEDMEYYGFYIDDVEDMSEVDTGWASANVDDAVEYLNEFGLEIPTVPEYEFPEKGKKPEDGYAAFKHFLGGLVTHAKDGAKIVNGVVVLPISYLLIKEDAFPDHVRNLVAYIKDQKASFAFEINRKVPKHFIEILSNNGFQKTERGYYRLDG